MAKHITLRIEDDETADKFAKEVETAESHGYPFVPKGAKVTHVFKTSADLLAEREARQHGKAAE